MRLYFADLWWSFLLLAIVSYLIGNVNFARIISKAKNKDITKLGSGNPGTMNMSRQFGLKTGLLTLLLDILKGAIPSFFAVLCFKGMYFGDSTLKVSEFALLLAGLFTVLGHVFPVIYKFKGGKGIATTIGVFLVAEWYITLIFAAVAIIYILITEMGSMGSFIATTPPAIACMVRFYNLGFKTEPSFDYGLIFFAVSMLLVVGIILLTWYAHRANIRRLLAGEEHETGWIYMIRQAKLRRKLKREEAATLSENKHLENQPNDGDNNQI